LEGYIIIGLFQKLMFHPFSFTLPMKNVNLHQMIRTSFILIKKIIPLCKSTWRCTLNLKNLRERHLKHPWLNFASSLSTLASPTSLLAGTLIRSLARIRVPSLLLLGVRLRGQIV